MTPLLSLHPSRATRLALSLIAAIIAVCALMPVGSMFAPTSAKAAVMPICSSAGEIAIQLPDGTGKCVENTCKAVLGAEGRADECDAPTNPTNVSVPDANSGVSGVAPVRAPVVSESAAPTRAAATSNGGTSVGVVLAWIFAGIGIAALLAGAVIFTRTRSRSRARDAAAGAEAPAPTASA